MVSGSNASRNGDIRQCHGRRHWVLTGAVGAIVLACTATGLTQVRQIQGGNALDANPAVGSGGYNGVRPVASGINGNLIMSGNATAGRSFQGFSPIVNPNTLQTSVGSGTLSNFVRDSVGLPGITGGLSPYVTRPYFDPSQTVISPGVIAAQSVLPRDLTGAYQVGQGQYQTPVAGSIGTTSTTSWYAGQPPYSAPGWTPAGIGMFNPDLVATSPGQIGPNPAQPYGLTGPLSVSEVGSNALQAESLLGEPGMPPTDLTGQPGQNGLPGQAGLQKQTGLAGQPNQAGLQGQPNQAGLPGQPNQAGQPGQRWQTNVLTPEDTTVQLGKPNEGESRLAGSLGDGRTGRGTRSAGQTTSSLMMEMQQRYAGVVQQAVAPGSVQQQVQQQPMGQAQQQPLDLSVASAAQRPTDDLRPLQPAATPLVRQQAISNMQREQASRLVTERLRTPIRSFAGARQTRVDQLLALAEEQMHKGEYYRASETYNGVITAAPDNALAWLGRANALLAAGEYVQAYLALTRGIEQFPHLMAFNFDLPALVGNKDILDVRRAEMEKMLAGNGDYRMRFLLGYLEYFSGVRELGLTTMQQAAKAAPANSIVPKAYGELEQRGAEPGPVSAPGR